MCLYIYYVFIVCGYKLVIIIANNKYSTDSGVMACVFYLHYDGSPRARCHVFGCDESALSRDKRFRRRDREREEQQPSVIFSRYFYIYALLFSLSYKSLVFLFCFPGHFLTRSGGVKCSLSLSRCPFLIRRELYLSTRTAVGTRFLS